MPTAPAITSADHTTFTVGSAGTFTVTTTGSATITLSETGPLPSGVTFTDNGDGTATLAGTPAAAAGGGYTLSIGATNGTAPDATQAFTLTVNEAVAITSPSTVDLPAATSGTFTVTTNPTATPVPTLTRSGTLPSGVTFTDNSDGTATIAGTPAAGAGGGFPLTITAHNGVGADAVQALRLDITLAIMPVNVTLPCPRCGVNRLFTNLSATPHYRCAGCEWRFLLATKSPTGTLNKAVGQGATALPVASGGASFTTGMLMLVGAGALAEAVTVTSTGSSTSIPVTALARSHASGAAIGQLAISPASSAAGEQAVPAAPGWGY